MQLGAEVRRIRNSLDFNVDGQIVTFEGPFTRETTDGDIDVTNPRPFAGISIPITLDAVTSDSEAHIPLPQQLMSADLADSTRRLPTGLDVLAIGQVAGFTDIELRAVPEPSVSFGILSLGLLFTLFSKKKTRFE